MAGAKYFTLIFAGDIRNIDGNIFNIDTVFGRCIAAGDGNAFEKYENAIEMEALLEEAIAFLGDEVPKNDTTVDGSFEDEARKLSDRIAAVIKQATGEV